VRWRPSRWPSCSSGEYSRHTARSRAPCDAPCVRGEPRAYTCVDSLGAPASGRLTDAQGENHVLKRYESGTALPPPARAPAMPSQSAPIAIAGARAGGDTGGRSGVSPMESDDESTFPISRSWDDIEGARSILNLNSPHGFPPMTGTSLLSSSLPTSFSLPTAAAFGDGRRQHRGLFHSPAQR